MNDQVNFRLINAKGQGGWTLIELMTALAVSLFLLLTVAYVVTVGQSTYRQNTAINRVQEQTNTAIETLSRHVRQAAYVPCGSAGLDAQYGNKPSPKIWRDVLPMTTSSTTDPIINLDNTGATDYVRVFPAQGTWVNGSEPTNLLSPSSVIEIASLAEENYTLLENTGQGANTLKILSNPNGEIKVNDYMVILNCAETGESVGEYVKVSAVTNGSPTIITLTQAMRFQYSINSRILRPSAKQFYVTQNTNTKLFNLNVREFQRVNGWVGAPARPLLYNVTKFDVKVGVDSNLADVKWQTDEYIPAAPTDTAVTSVENGPNIASLLITYQIESSEKNISTELDDPNATVPSQKRFKRPVQTLLIGLRNRTD